jgi:hypothetical protein
LSCHDFDDNQVRLQLFVLAYILGNFLRRVALPASVKHWTLTTLRDKLIKIGAKVVRHAWYVTFQLAEVPFGGRNSALSDPIPVRVRQIVGLVRRNESTIALKCPGDGSGRGSNGKCRI